MGLRANQVRTSMRRLRARSAEYLRAKARMPGPSRAPQGPGSPLLFSLFPTSCFHVFTHVCLNSAHATVLGDQFRPKIAA